LLTLCQESLMEVVLRAVLFKLLGGAGAAAALAINGSPANMPAASIKAANRDISFLLFFISSSFHTDAMRRIL